MFQIIPSAGLREERLRNPESKLVVVCVQKPGRDIVPLLVKDLVCSGVEDINTEQVDLVERRAFRSFASKSLKLGIGPHSEPITEAD